MFDPRILLGLVLAGAWAGALHSLGDEIERDEQEQSDTPEPGDQGADQPEILSRRRKHIRFRA